MKIALGSDHRGVEIARALEAHLRAHGHATTVLGKRGDEDDGASWDYPDSARAVADAVQRGDVDCGILICGSGIGMSIAANKVRGVRAALAVDAYAAKMTRAHNDANVLCLAADRLTPDHARTIVDAFVGSAFDGGRHQRRVDKIAALESAQHADDACGAAPGA